MKNKNQTNWPDVTVATLQVQLNLKSSTFGNLNSQPSATSHLPCNMHVHVEASQHTTYSHSSINSLSLETPSDHIYESSYNQRVYTCTDHSHREREIVRTTSFEMASSDKTPTPSPAFQGDHPTPPGKPMTMGQHVLDKGAEMMQSLKPVNQMSQHVCTFALYSHDMTRQIETHHYVTRLNQDFLQCAVYDSDDSHARLIGKDIKATLKRRCFGKKGLINFRVVVFLQVWSMWCLIGYLRLCLRMSKSCGIPMLMRSKQASGSTLGSPI